MWNGKRRIHTAMMKEERSLSLEDHPGDSVLSAYIASPKLERQAQTPSRR
jgi:hypothetical protein